MTILSQRKIYNTATMRTYTEEELTVITTYSEIGLSYKEISIILEVPLHQFLSDLKTNPKLKTAYETGYIESRVNLNNKINALARNGSAAAQIEMRKIQMEQNIKNFMMTIDE